MLRLYMPFVGSFFPSRVGRVRVSIFVFIAKCTHIALNGLPTLLRRFLYSIIALLQRIGESKGNWLIAYPDGIGQKVFFNVGK